METKKMNKPEIFSILAILVLLSGFVIIKNPSITGFAVLQEAPGGTAENWFLCAGCGGKFDSSIWSEQIIAGDDGDEPDYRGFLDYSNSGSEYMQIDFPNLSIGDIELVSNATVTIEYLGEEGRTFTHFLQCYSGTSWISLENPPSASGEDADEAIANDNTFTAKLDESCIDTLDKLNNITIRFGVDGTESGKIYVDYAYVNATLNVTSIITDKKFYARGNTVAVDGKHFTPNSGVMINISGGSAISGYPESTTSDSSGSIIHNIVIPDDMQFNLGDYKITANETNSKKSAKTDIKVVIKPDTAFNVSGNDMKDVSGEINESDGIYVSMASGRAGKRDNNYIMINFTENMPAGSLAKNAAFHFEHYESKEGKELDILWYNSSSENYISVCSISTTTSERFDNCSLSFIGEFKDADNISIRIEDGTLTPNQFAYVDFAYLIINFTAQDTANPGLNHSINNTEPGIYDVVNITADVSDETALSHCSFYRNTSDGSFIILDKPVYGTDAQCSQDWTIELARGNVINFTILVNDTSGNKNQSEQIITVANFIPTPDIVFPTNDLKTSLQPLDLNVTFEERDNDAVAISYYINGILNQTSFANTTLNASDGAYILNVSVADNVNQSANVTVNFTIDTTVPAAKLSIAGFTPVNNSVNVSLKEDIVAIFGSELDKSTLNSNTIYLKDSSNAGIKGSINYIKPFKKLRFKPYRFLKENESYTATLTTGIKDKNGLNLESDISWNFTTELRDTDNDGIPDSDDGDIDNDDIDDAIDYIVGNATNINTNFDDITIYVNNTRNFSRRIEGRQSIKFQQNNKTLLDFEFVLSNISKLHFTNISVLNSSNATSGSIMVGGINVGKFGSKKTVYLERININFNEVCVKDKEIEWIDEISETCNEDGEYRLKCDGTTQNGYACEYNSTGNLYRITGLSHSGAKQIESGESDESSGATIAEEPAAEEPVQESVKKSSGDSVVNVGLIANTNLIRVILKGSEVVNETIVLNNTGTISLSVFVLLEQIKNFVTPETYELYKVPVVIMPGKSVNLNFSFTARDANPDIYPAEITLKGIFGEKKISTVIEVESSKPLFDVDVEVLPPYKSSYPGDDILINVNVFNIRGFGRVDVNIQYAIKDLDGNLIVMEEETLAVETKARFTRDLLLPNNIKPGIYIAAVKVSFEDSVGTSSDLFEVKAKSITLYPVELKDYTPYIAPAVVFIILMVLFIILEFYRIRRKHGRTKVEEGEVIKTEGKKEKLETELRALEEAYNSKLISESTYQKEKKKLEKRIGRLE